MHRSPIRAEIPMPPGVRRMSAVTPHLEHVEKGMPAASEVTAGVARAPPARRKDSARWHPPLTTAASRRRYSS
jgi:hypothetical protein